MRKLNLLTIIMFAMIMTLFGILGTTPTQAATYNTGSDPPVDLTLEFCMADAYLEKPGNSLSQGALNCTANDVEITQVIPVNAAEECTPGEIFTFSADVYVKTNANERWDPTFYLPLTEDSPQVVQGRNDNCSIVLPIPDGEGAPANAQLDGDGCSDITKALGPDEYVLENEPITMLCTPDPNDPTRALFTYCAAWDNQDRDNCSYEAGDWADGTTYTPGQIPNTKSKCKCDDFPIDVFIKPPAPDIFKSEGSPTTLPEPGGDYSFTMSFTNPSLNASMFITDMFDHVDIGGEGGFDTVLDLLGGTTSVDPTDPNTDEGVYLKDNSSCITNFNATAIPGEVGPEATFSCSFTVTIVDRDLPGVLIPEDYDDAIKVVLEDKNGEPVIDGNTCVAVGLTEVDGEHCSVLRTVQVSNLPPTITVTKTPSDGEVLEPGQNVTFDIVVTSTSGNYDDPLTITDLLDDYFTDLDGLGDCAKGGSLFLGSPYSCSFTEFIGGNAGDVHNNTVTAYAVDNEGDIASNSEGATVNINDVPSAILLVKTADPIEVLETGDDLSVFRDVDYTFLFSVNAAGVDNVTFSSLIDEVPPLSGFFTDLTNDCEVDMKNGGAIAKTPLNGFVLSPGEYASCTITLPLQGNADDVRTNLATIYGTDDDGQPVDWSDDAVVTFLDAPLDITPEFAMKARVFVRLTNGGVDNATISVLTIMQTNLVPGAGSVAAGFEILDETPGYSYQAADGPYAFCAAGTVIVPGETYECAFTIKLYPGFVPATDDIIFVGTGVDPLVVTLVDDDGSETTESISIEIYTLE